MTDAIAALLPQLRPLATAASGFDETIALCAGVAAGVKRPAEAESAAAGAGVSAETQRALVSVFLEAARTSMSADELASTLASVLPAERASAVASIATEGQAPMQRALESLSLAPDELVDVSWHRASVAAAGRELPRPGGDPFYTVTLTLRAADGSTRPLQFTASIEELNALVTALKGAVREVEREIGA